MTKQVELKAYDKNALDDLFSGTSQEDSGNKNTITLPIDSIILPPSQPRRYFDPQKIQSLAENIKENGLLSPIVVRSTSSNDEFELVAGERRLRASKLAGLEDIPVNIIDCDENAAARIRLVENLQREDLNAYEETIGIVELLAAILNIDQKDVVYLLNRMLDEEKNKVPQNVLGSNESLIIQDLFSKLGKITWQSFATTRLPLLKLPSDIQDVLIRGQLEYTKAHAIARVKNEQARGKIVKQAIDEGLSLSQIKEIVESIMSAGTTDKKETPFQQLASRGKNVQGLLKKHRRFIENDKKITNKINRLLDQIEELFPSETENTEMENLK
ncbi:MAG: ParB/RepB/Spo0J family partition protein [Pelatocladus maniniholoensis HA4357-MV3]|jgi:ParB family chromosome partitioning protein|uniref:ParB/RepB/Spo0J family partition protein n=1 Tax=Pelatocladus maniniholoensis HA4357-MV3 TaxID=1117104 RepID=A0A9E3LVB1_9NOST|nr:ParB/RepB/Spo0J family partition protein [Pelatocladus maniniholoensis HA4357-MV3]BAZ70735.1 ParB family protein [Fischerella sp. NIES-4106]